VLAGSREPAGLEPVGPAQVPPLSLQAHPSTLACGRAELGAVPATCSGTPTPLMRRLSPSACPHQLIPPSTLEDAQRGELGGVAWEGEPPRMHSPPGPKLARELNVSWWLFVVVLALSSHARYDLGDGEGSRCSYYNTRTEYQGEAHNPALHSNGMRPHRAWRHTFQ